MAESETPRTDAFGILPVSDDIWTDLPGYGREALEKLLTEWGNLSRQLERELHLKDQKIAEAEARAESLQSQLAAAQREPKWIPVTEKLPDLDTTVLIWSDVVNLGWCEIAGVFRGCNLGYDGDSAVDDGVTHWMPLPELPIDTAQGDPS